MMDMKTTDFVPFSLQDKEKIITELKPERKGFILSSIIKNIIGVAILLVISWFILGALILNIFSYLLILFIAFNIIAPFIAYDRYKYWVTNLRVIGSRGLIGYTVESIPLENITDVTLIRNIEDQMLGISSLLIVPIGGLMVGYKRGGGSNYFPALKPDKALELQSLIFKLRDARKDIKN